MQPEALIVEDDYDAEFRYDREPVRALQGVAPDHVVQLGTVSKTLAPALRLGWLVAPPALADEAARTKRLLDDFSPALDQLTLAELLTRGHYDRHVRRARAVYRARRDRMLAALEKHLPELTVEGVAAGVHLLLRLPRGVDDRAIADALRDASIAVPPLSAFRIRPSDEGGLVIGYGRLHESAVAPATRALAKLIRRAPGLRKRARVKEMAAASERVRVRRGPHKARYDRATIDAILDRGLLCHVAFAVDEDAYCVPMLYARVGDTVYIHGSAASRALRALANGASACLTVTVVDGLVLARSAFEHSTNYESVMVFGRFTNVAELGERMVALEAFTEKLLPGRWSEVRGPTERELKATAILVDADRGSVGEAPRRARPTTTTAQMPRSTPGPASSRSRRRSASPSPHRACARAFRSAQAFAGC